MRCVIGSWQCALVRSLILPHAPGSSPPCPCPRRDCYGLALLKRLSPAGTRLASCAGLEGLVALLVRRGAKGRDALA